MNTARDFLDKFNLLDPVVYLTKRNVKKTSRYTGGFWKYVEMQERNTPTDLVYTSFFYKIKKTFLFKGASVATCRPIITYIINTVYISLLYI